MLLSIVLNQLDFSQAINAVTEFDNMLILCKIIYVIFKASNFEFIQELFSTLWIKKCLL